MNLKWKMITTALISLMIAIIALIILLYATTIYIDGYFNDDERWMELTAGKARDLQNYVTENNLTTEDWDMIKSWNRRNSGVYLYIYDSDGTIYETSTRLAAYSYENYTPLKFSDRTVDMSIFYAIDIRYYTVAVVIEILLSVVLFLYLVMRAVRRLINDIKRLEKDVKILEGGSLEHEVKSYSDDELGSLEKSINEMRITIKGNFEREDALMRANRDIVTRMAHDLRTPLTSLLLYLDLINDRKYKDDEELRRYVSISKHKAEKIKYMSDLLFERLLITSSREEEAPYIGSVRHIFEDPLSSFVMSLDAQEIETVADIRWPDGLISVQAAYIDRILDNIYSNIIKYADRSGPVTLTLGEAQVETAGEASGEELALSISNHIGNRSNSEGGSNIGLENIGMMLEKMNGRLDVLDDGETFRITIILPFA